jgi:hypothetical protein
MHDRTHNFLQWDGGKKNPFSKVYDQNTCSYMEGLRNVVNFLLFFKVWSRRKFRLGSNNIFVYFPRWKRFSAYHSFINRLSSFAFVFAPDQSQCREAFGIFWFPLFCRKKLRNPIDFIRSCSILPTILPSVSVNHLVSCEILKHHCKTWTAKIVFVSKFGKQAQIFFKTPSRHETCQRFSFPGIFNLSAWVIMLTHVQQRLHIDRQTIVYSFTLLRHGNNHSSFNSPMKFFYLKLRLKYC